VRENCKHGSEGGDGESRFRPLSGFLKSPGYRATPGPFRMFRNSGRNFSVIGGHSGKSKTHHRALPLRPACAVFRRHRASGRDRSQCLDRRSIRPAENLRKPRKLSTIVIHAFPQTGLGKRGSPIGKQPQRKLGMFPQRRKGRKGGRKMVKTIFENIFPSPPNLAPLRLGGRNFRIGESSTSGIFKRHVMTNMLVLVFG
jgi:hypothetical protein